jgi:hypothetical protein
VSQGGEPGHDDYGLPRVDIQIPDDARELYRDVQAYHRELRALRRQERSRRWGAPLRRSGMVLPVIAGFLVLAMIAGMILTMFSANPYLVGSGAPPPNPTATHVPGQSGGSERASQSAGAVAAGVATQPWQMPQKTILVSDRKRVWLPRIKTAALVIIPARCGCTRAIRQLLAKATSAGVTVYLIGRPGSSLNSLRSLAPARTGSTAVLAIDAENALHSVFGSSGLEIMLVNSRGLVTVISEPQPGSQIERQLERLKPTG